MGTVTLGPPAPIDQFFVVSLPNLAGLDKCLSPQPNQSRTRADPETRQGFEANPPVPARRLAWRPWGSWQWVLCISGWPPRLGATFVRHPVSCLQASTQSEPPSVSPASKFDRHRHIHPSQTTAWHKRVKKKKAAASEPHKKKYVFITGSFCLMLIRPE